MLNNLLLQGVSEKDVQGVVHSFNLNELYYPTLFPLKQVYDLTWKSLNMVVGQRIAGDVIARGATIDEKTREVVSKVYGDIPKIAISRAMVEDDFIEYQILQSKTKGEAELQRMVEIWANDLKFCFDGVANRLEWMALKSISSGKLSLDQNNSGVITQYDCDYQIDASQKVGVMTDWSNTSTAKPFTQDFKNVVAAARKQGIYLKYVLMNEETFAKLTQVDEVIKMCASFAQNALNIAYTPDLAQVNSAISRLSYLYGLQIVIINQNITIEHADGSRESGNPFNTNVCTFVESKQLGNTYWMKPVEMDVNTFGYKALNGHTCVRRYAENRPLKEYTEGIANAMPAWGSALRSYLMKTDNTSWNL